MRVEDLILPVERVRVETILLFFKRLGVGTITSHDQAAKLSATIFGSADLKSHFSVSRWGGCDPAIIDEVEAAGAAGLAHFGYAPWRDLVAAQDPALATGAAGGGNGNGCSVGASQIQVPGTAAMGGGKGEKGKKGQKH